jgi:hypothetical protein
MTLIDEIQQFSRDFINVKAFRTYSRKQKIREAYKQLFGENIKVLCNTCYIEAIFKIINSKPMSTPNYRLKKGSFLQPFGHPELAGGDAELTDEKAKKILEVQPELAIYFERIPFSVPDIPKTITIIPPKERIVEPAEIVKELISSATGEKKVRKTPVKSKAKK